MLTFITMIILPSNGTTKKTITTTSSSTIMVRRPTLPTATMLCDSIGGAKGHHLQPSSTIVQASHRIQVASPLVKDPPVAFPACSSLKWTIKAAAVTTEPNRATHASDDMSPHMKNIVNSNASVSWISPAPQAPLKTTTLEKRSLAAATSPTTTTLPKPRTKTAAKVFRLIMSKSTCNLTSQKPQIKRAIHLSKRKVQLYRLLSWNSAPKSLNEMEGLCVVPFEVDEVEETRLDHRRFLIAVAILCKKTRVWMMLASSSKV